ncbi:PA14 domain-containing protein [Candidatus Latescibacterota bacterium]
MTASLNFNDDTKAATLLYDYAKVSSVKLEPYIREYFIDSTTIGLRPEPKDAIIHYTLDGSEPTLNSLHFRKQVVITDEAILKAKAFCDGYDDNRLLVVEFTKMTPKPSIIMMGLVQGLKYSVYHGEWDMLPNFIKIKSVNRGTIDSFDIPRGVREDNFAVLYRGYIEIEEDGAYTFFTKSDDCSKLLIGDTLVVDNDGLHGFQDKDGVIALMAGKHPITLSFFEKGGGQDLEVSYTGPGLEKRIIDGSVLFRDR